MPAVNVPFQSHLGSDPVGVDIRVANESAVGIFIDVGGAAVPFCAVHQKPVLHECVWLQTQPVKIVGSLQPGFEDHGRLRLLPLVHGLGPVGCLESFAEGEFPGSGLDGSGDVESSPVPPVPDHAAGIEVIGGPGSYCRIARSDLEERQNFPGHSQGRVGLVEGGDSVEPEFFFEVDVEAFDDFLVYADRISCTERRRQIIIVVGESRKLRGEYAHERHGHKFAEVSFHAVKDFHVRVYIVQALKSLVLVSLSMVLTCPAGNS